MNLLLSLNPPPLKQFAVPLLGLCLTAGCSSDSDSSGSIIDLQTQSPGETTIENSELSSVENSENAAVPSTIQSNTTEDAITAPDGITTFPGCESSASDPDGDGFGFENGVSCMVALSMYDEVPASEEPLSDDTTPDGITTFPTCESSASDPDGDGFGFENNASCVVVISIDDETPASEEPLSDATTPDGITTFPGCESSATDPDGDGFGFENNVSCVVTLSMDDETPASEGPLSDDTTPDGITTFPGCESSATDPDGDGFGFENNVSCVVTLSMDDETPASEEPLSDETTTDGITTFPSCESSATDPDGDGFGFENGVSCLVASPDTTESDETDINDQSASDNTTEQDADAAETELASSPFFEAFSAPLPSFTTDDRTTDGATAEFSFSDGSGIIRVDSATDERERGRFTLRGRIDSLSAVVSIEPGSIAFGEGRVQALVTNTLYNDTSESPVGGDCFAGDVGVQVIMRLNADNTTQFVFSAFRETQSECGNSEDANIFDGMTYVALDAGPELGVSHRLGLSIDRASKLVTINIDDEAYTYTLETDVFQPGSPFSSFEARVERGPGTAIVRFDELNYDDQTFDFSDPGLLGRYTFWDAGDPETSISYPNGELRLESTSDSNSRGENRLAVTGHDTRYARAQVRLSSDSIAAGGGDARVRVGGSLYYASDIPGDRSSLHQVFAVTEIVLLESGATEARYCAWQSLDDSFTQDIALVNPDNESGCNTFTLTPVLDQNYTVATWMDDANRRIVFSIDGEEHFHNVEGPISIGDELFEMRVQSRATGDGSRAVIFVDNLESLPGAAP